MSFEISLRPVALYYDILKLLSENRKKSILTNYSFSQKQRNRNGLVSNMQIFHIFIGCKQEAVNKKLIS